MRSETDESERYQIGRELARGAMGAIHEASDLRLSRTVAVKQLLSRSGHGDARLRREALLTARLHGEVEFIDFMRQAFGTRVLYSDDAPRAHADGLPIHLDPTLPVSNYQKGKSGLVDCLRLAASDYLVKGRSNLSDASLAFNPRLPYSFCLR